MFFRYLEKEKGDIEPLFIDRVLNKEHFNGKICKNVCQKLVPDHFLISVYKPKKPLHARNSFKNNILQKRNISC